MLNDHERKSLRELEQRFMAEDPEFTRSFEARQARLSRHPRRRGSRIALVAGMLLVGLLLIAGSLAGALVVAVTAGMVWMAWRYPDAPGRRAQETTGE